MLPRHRHHPRRVTVRSASVLVTLAAYAALSGCGSGSSAGESAASQPADATATAATNPAASSTAAATNTPDTDSASANSDAGAATQGDNQGDNTVAVPAALQFTAPLIGGGELDANTLATGKPVLFWFWAPF